MPKPIIYGTGQPVTAQLPDMTPPAQSNGGGWDKAIGQVAAATPKLLAKKKGRKSKKPWPSDAGKAGYEVGGKA